MVIDIPAHHDKILVGQLVLDSEQCLCIPFDWRFDDFCWKNALLDFRIEFHALFSMLGHDVCLLYAMRVKEMQLLKNEGSLVE